MRRPPVYCVAIAILASGCLGPGSKEDVADTTGAGAAPGRNATSDLLNLTHLYVVATDSGSPNSEGIFKFRPAELRAKVGEEVNLTFKSGVGNLFPHNFVLQGHDVRFNAVGAGDFQYKILNLTQAGTFRYYCDARVHPSNGALTHAQLGMEGRLIVS